MSSGGFLGLLAAGGQRGQGVDEVVAEGGVVVGLVGCGLHWGAAAGGCRERRPGGSSGVRAGARGLLLLGPLCRHIGVSPQEAVAQEGEWLLLLPSLVLQAEVGRKHGGDVGPLGGGQVFADVEVEGFFPEQVAQVPDQVAVVQGAERQGEHVALAA